MLGPICEKLTAQYPQAHLYASAISDHLQGLNGREVLRQAKIDVVPIYKPEISADTPRTKETSRDPLSSCRSIRPNYIMTAATEACLET